MADPQSYAGHEYLEMREKALSMATECVATGQVDPYSMPDFAMFCLRFLAGDLPIKAPEKPPTEAVVTRKAKH